MCVSKLFETIQGKMKPKYPPKDPPIQKPQTTEIWTPFYIMEYREIPDFDRLRIDDLSLNVNTPFSEKWNTLFFTLKLQKPQIPKPHYYYKMEFPANLKKHSDFILCQDYQKTQNKKKTPI